MEIEIKNSLKERFYEWMGEENLRWFKHLKGLTGTYSPVLKLNQKKRRIPVHPVHLREGMRIRNWMRRQDECDGWDGHDFDNNWTKLIGETIEKFFE